MYFDFDRTSQYNPQAKLLYETLINLVFLQLHPADEHVLDNRHLYPRDYDIPVGCSL